MRTISILLAAAALSALAVSACSPEAKTEAKEAVADASKAVSEGAADLKAKLDAATKGATAPHEDAGPGVYFVNLHDGETVTSPFRVVFGVYGMGIAPAGTDKEKTGHHHLLIDTEMTADQMKAAIDKDANHMHFGDGATETVLTLPPGQHTLQLDFGDKGHNQFNPPLMSKKITITVK